METINIKAKAFFNFIKTKDISMWEVMEQMIDGKEKAVIFEGEKGEILMRYILPDNKEQLKNDQKKFTQLLAQQIATEQLNSKG